MAAGLLVSGAVSHIASCLAWGVLGLMLTGSWARPGPSPNKLEG